MKSYHSSNYQTLHWLCLDGELDVDARLKELNLELDMVAPLDISLLDFESPNSRISKILNKV